MEQPLGLTPRQKQVLAYIKLHTEVHEGVPPSYQQIADSVGLKSKSRVHHTVHALMDRGHLRAASCGHGAYVKPRSIAAKGPSAELVDAVLLLCAVALTTGELPTREHIELELS